jgi:hypothetical protein
MFGSVSRRWLAVVGVLTVALAGGVAVAVASGGSTPKLPKAQSPKERAGALEAKVRAHAGPKASATVAGHQATVSCGQSITADTTLDGDLLCGSQQSGIIIDADGVTLNLNGHFIFGSTNQPGPSSGVKANGASDTIENGYIFGFGIGVFAHGSSDTVTNLQINDTGPTGTGILFDAGTSNGSATGNTSAENFGTGISDFGTNDLIQSNNLLNNGLSGLDEHGAGAQIRTNVANGNAVDGLASNGAVPPVTFFHNTANFNGNLGIEAFSPAISGPGGNRATGNQNPKQCSGVVCS